MFSFKLNLVLPLFSSIYITITVLSRQMVIFVKPPSGFLSINQYKTYVMGKKHLNSIFSSYKMFFYAYFLATFLARTVRCKWYAHLTIGIINRSLGYHEAQGLLLHSLLRAKETRLNSSLPARTWAELQLQFTTAHWQSGQRVPSSTKKHA